jgi:putative phage-type endonuclease
VKLLNMLQGSKEWLVWRRSHITATDASIIMGIHPWCSPKKLWEEKLEMILPDPVNEAMMLGTQLEPEARVKAIEVLGINFMPAVVEHEDRVWQVASLDGLSECRKYILEIKCPGKKNHDFAKKGEIPEYHMYQMQHQLSVTDAEKCFYVSYRPEDKEKPFVHIEVLPLQSMIEEMIDMEHRFYGECLCSMKDPTKLKRFCRDG